MKHMTKLDWLLVACALIGLAGTFYLECQIEKDWPKPELVSKENK